MCKHGIHTSVGTQTHAHTHMHTYPHTHMAGKCLYLKFCKISTLVCSYSYREKKRGGGGAYRMGVGVGVGGDEWTKGNTTKDLLNLFSLIEEWATVAQKKEKRRVNHARVSTEPAGKTCSNHSAHLLCTVKTNNKKVGQATIPTSKQHDRSLKRAGYHTNKQAVWSRLEEGRLRYQQASSMIKAWRNAGQKKSWGMTSWKPAAVCYLHWNYLLCCQVNPSS